MFEPYKNDHQSMQIGELIFENQTDKVIIYGDIDITNDKVGLENALKLQKVFNDIVSELKNQDNNSNNGSDDENTEAKVNEHASNHKIVSEQPQSGKKIDNPFA